MALLKWLEVRNCAEVGIQKIFGFWNHPRSSLFYSLVKSELYIRSRKIINLPKLFLFLFAEDERKIIFWPHFVLFYVGVFCSKPKKLDWRKLILFVCDTAWKKLFLLIALSVKIFLTPLRSFFRRHFLLILSELLHSSSELINVSWQKVHRADYLVEAFFVDVEFSSSGHIVVTRGILGTSVVESKVNVDVGHWPNNSIFMEGEERRLGNFTDLIEMQISITLSFGFIETLDGIVSFENVCNFKVPYTDPSVITLFLEIPDLNFEDGRLFPAIQTLLRDKEWSEHWIEVLFDVLSLLHHFPLVVLNSRRRVLLQLIWRWLIKYQKRTALWEEFLVFNVLRKDLKVVMVFRSILDLIFPVLTFLLFFSKLLDTVLLISKKLTQRKLAVFSYFSVHDPKEPDFLLPFFQKRSCVADCSFCEYLGKIYPNFGCKFSIVVQMYK